MRLLDYIAVYGLVLVPIGAVVFAEHVLFPRLGIEPAERAMPGVIFNRLAAASLL